MIMKIKELLPHFRFRKENLPGYREILIFVIFLIFYKISRYIAIGDEQTAFENAYRVVEWEKMMGIFYEIEWQQFFLDYTWIIKGVNQFYVRMHLPTTIILFIWLYHYKRKYYFYIRNGFLIANIITLFFFIGFPCAPPRMLNDIGFIDTLLVISDINLYQGNLSKLFNQYAAVPSMHFGNSLLIAVVCLILAKHKLVKYGMVIYPIFVLWMIVITGNHFFVDAILGGIIVLIPYPFMTLAERLFPAVKWLNSSRFIPPARATSSGNLSTSASIIDHKTKKAQTQIR